MKLSGILKTKPIEKIHKEKPEIIKEAERFAKSKGVDPLVLDRKAAIVTYKDGYNERQGKDKPQFFPDIGKPPGIKGLKERKVSQLDVDRLKDGAIFTFCIPHGDCYTAQVRKGEKNRWLRIWRNLERGQGLAVNLAEWKMNANETNIIAEEENNFVTLPYFLEEEGPSNLIAGQKQAEFSGTNWITNISNLTLYSPE